MGRLVTRDTPYKPLPIFVLDPLEYTAMGLAVLKRRNGEKLWEQCHKAKWHHPDPQKVACVHNGAIIYTALFPNRTHAAHRPPKAWLHEAGVTEASLAEAKKALHEEDPHWEAKRDVRKAVNEIMDGLEKT